MGRLLVVGVLLAGAIPALGQETPSQAVARMAREAMGGSEDPAAWHALATALPDLALEGGADLEATFEAARLADSIARAAGVVPGRAADGPGRRADGFLGGPSGLLLWGAAGMLTLMGAAVMTARRRKVTAGPTPAPAAPVASRLTAARSLLTSGMSAAEVARRTGMAQEAVEVLVALTHGRALAGAGVKDAPDAGARRARGRGRYGSAPIRGPRGAPGEERLRREAREAARRLRDRRLVYGPGGES